MSSVLCLPAEAVRRGLGGEERSHEGSASGTSTPEYSDSEAGSDSAPRERHECAICGITTTSAAHLEVISQSCLCATDKAQML